jgi:hypothetical protein
MQFTGTSSVLLPQVSQFSFALTGLKVSNTGIVNFNFYDTGTGVFTIGLSGGLISTDRTISTYNTVERNRISGYLQSGVLTYLINGVVGQQNVTFSKLNKITVQAPSTVVACNLNVSANQINYSLSFPSSYKYFGSITGSLVSDTAFPINSVQVFSFNSRQNLLTANYATGLSIVSGTNSIVLNDVDNSFFEYQNDFDVTMPAAFGDVGNEFSAYRSGIINQSVLSLSPSTGNTYAQTSLFDGSWSGTTFTYSDNPLVYNLGFNYSNFAYNGVPNASTLTVAFYPLTPLNGSGYQAQYITGLTIATGGNYSSSPTAQFSQYYYVTGLQNSLQSFLFSSGCSGIPVTFSGGSPTSGASGSLVLKQVRLSGVYGAGVNTFKIISGYSGISSGLGYQSAPNFVLGTGGGCYSLPDVSGTQTAQFRFASGLGAIYAQAAGLTGLVLTSGSLSGYVVTGIQVTNIGFGYSASFPPNLTFQRVSGDVRTGNASGTFSYKTTGNYQFNNIWDVAVNLGTGLNSLTEYTGYFSGSMNVFGNGNLGLQIKCTNLDNTSAVSGLLVTRLTVGSQTITNQQVIYQTRTFDLYTGALLPFSSPQISVIPLSDLNYILSQDPYDAAFQNAYDGGSVNNIIYF